MYSSNILNCQESVTILNACTKEVWKRIECTTYIIIIIIIIKDVINWLKLNTFRPCVPNAYFSATTYFFSQILLYSCVLFKISIGSRLVRRVICSLPPLIKDQEVSGCMLFLASWLCVSRGLLGANGLWFVQHAGSESLLIWELVLVKSVLDKNLWICIYYLWTITVLRYDK